MVTIEQVRQLETRVAKAIDYVNRVTEENTLLKNKLDNYQKRIDELEVLIQRFKEDQGRIEEGIVSALDRLNQFEDDVEKTLAIERKPAKTGHGAALKPAAHEKLQVEPPIDESESPIEPDLEASVSSLDADAAKESGNSELDIF